MTVINMTLDQSSIEAALKRVEAMRTALRANESAFVATLAEEGAQAARAAVADGVGDEQNSIDSAGVRSAVTVTGSGTSRAVTATGPQLSFVEFGTGVVGSGTYPDSEALARAGWAYDQRRTPSAHDADDPTMWYWSHSDGLVHSTHGMAANAFMLAGAEHMRSRLSALAKETFRF